MVNITRAVNLPVQTGLIEKISETRGVFENKGNTIISNFGFSVLIVLQIKKQPNSNK